MKKKLPIIIAAVAVLILVTILFIFKSNSTDAAKFKKEYESYNNKATAKGYKYQNLKIPKKNKIKYISLSEAVDVLNNNTAIIYFGYPNCPWCRGMLPTLIDRTNNSDLKNLYYVDMTDMRDVYVVDDSNEVTKEKDASEDYYKLLDILDEYLEDYTITDDDGIEHVVPEKRIYVPLVVAVEDGVIKDAHTGSVDLNEGQSPYDALSDTQISELSAIFDRLISSIEDGIQVCDEHC